MYFSNVDKEISDLFNYLYYNHSFSEVDNILTEKAKKISNAMMNGFNVRSYVTKRLLFESSEVINVGYIDNKVVLVAYKSVSIKKHLKIKDFLIMNDVSATFKLIRRQDDLEFYSISDTNIIFLIGFVYHKYNKEYQISFLDSNYIN